MYKILAKLFGRVINLHYLPSCHSTNEIAQNMVNAGCEEGTLVVTDDQFAGKGQRGNNWVAEPGKNLTMSLVLKPEFLKPDQQFLITVAISLGVKAALDEHISGEVKVKWPNDIYHNNKKIAGILIENAIRGNCIDSCIVGIGLNVNQNTFIGLSGATSIKSITGKVTNLNDLLNRILVKIDLMYGLLRKGEYGLLQNEYHECLLGRGEERMFMAGGEEFEGMIQATDATGRLIVWSPSKTYVFNNKEVEMLF